VPLLRTALPADEHARGLVRALVDSRASASLNTEIKGFTAVCDAAHYAGVGIPGVIYGASGDGFHGKDEYVDLDSLAAVARTLAVATINWCGVR
jgi:acetylornithine deacetylase/succinyl-diaminopimelate desuccinylase-like protein